MSVWDEYYATADPTSGNNALLYNLLSSFAPGQQTRVMEFGCGTGDNIAYWMIREADYYGIDGSERALNELLRKRPYLKRNVSHCDFTVEQEFNEEFDVVFDRASVSHNNIPGMTSALNNAWNCLKKGGMFVGSDWFANTHSEANRGDIFEHDPLTRHNYPDGQFHNAGAVTFCGLNEIRSVMGKFELIYIQLRSTVRPMFVRARQRWVSPHFDGKEYVSAVWDIVLRK